MYEVFAKLLSDRGLKAADVCRGTGLPSSFFSEWKRGKSNPKMDKLQKIADFFDVPVEYLVTGKLPEDKNCYYVNKETAEIAQQIFERKELRGLFDTAKDSKPEDLKVVNDMLLALKRKEHPENEGC